MSLEEDWNIIGEGDYSSLDETRTAQGSSSLKHTGFGYSDIFVFEDSITDSPTQATVISELYPSTATNVLLCCSFRSEHTTYPETDEDTGGYFISAGYSTNSNELELQAVERGSGGFDITSQKIVTLSQNDLSGVTLSDGNPPTGRFVPYRIDMWTDSGDLRFRYSEDADRDGNWTPLLGSNDFVCGTLASGTSGKPVGRIPTSSGSSSVFATASSA